MLSRVEHEKGFITSDQRVTPETIVHMFLTQILCFLSFFSFRRLTLLAGDSLVCVKIKSGMS